MATDARARHESRRAGTRRIRRAFALALVSAAGLLAPIARAADPELPPPVPLDPIPDPVLDPFANAVRVDATPALGPPPLRLWLSPDAPIGARVFSGPGNAPPLVLAGVGFSWDLDPHPWRVLREPRFRYRLAAGATIVGLLGYGFTDYWAHMSDNSVDWELSWSAPSFYKKVWTLEAVRFDTNKFETNTYSHPAAGTMTYLAARGAGLGAGESFLFSFGGSLVWEYLGEYREKVSLNDIVLTPQGGFALGESLHQLGLFFERGEDNTANNVLALVFSPFRYLHRRLDHGYVARAKTLDDLGLPADAWHRFDVFVGVSAETGKDGLRLSQRRIGVSTEIIDVPEYDHPGELTKSLDPGAVTSIRLVGSVDDQGVEQLDFITRVLLGGVYDQKIVPDGHGGRRGYAIFAGPSTAFNYAKHRQEGMEEDKLGVANALGATVDLTLHHGKARARASVDAYGDFGAVHSMAASAYIRTRGDEGLKTVVADKRYYFALGATVRPTLALSYRRFELGAQLTYDFFESIEGLDRYQERVANDVHLRDQRSSERVWLSYTLPSDKQRLAWVEVEHLDRRGRMGSFRASHESTKFRAGIAFRF
ncbi:DUF3943 domain-containing protein [Polyangium sp. 15x6]|uniref:DUF3943 domain-containing protein n=1 Tax=Polyangium sp. 15x6 TaxID=3042687 RepID=UPI00249B259E|nr:DUF3943 domain-containing protein [Polyangium sp. 15x6]MDI3284537.1 DUF3943 domain-containing protein [Polyangium sp. 15x6]